ncbi:MAG TPA: amidase [Candidatus Binataceae bacterium]
MALNSDEIALMDATAQAKLVATGAASASELIEAAIHRIELLNPKLNCVIYPRFNQARAEAADAKKLAQGIFRGLPFLMKDLSEMVAGEPTSWGWKPLKDKGFLARSTSYVALKFRTAGLITLGQSTVPEWGPSIATETRAWGATRNPWNLDRGVGGSSGGAGAAVASGMVPIAHGNDAGGSIRIPASFCGVVGLKPSRGRTSIGPLHADIWHGLGEEGALVRSVRDAAAALDVVCGYMPGDPYAGPVNAGPFCEEIKRAPGSLRIGFMDRAPSFHSGIHPDCATAVRNAAKLLESLGHKVEQAHPASLDDDRRGAPRGDPMRDPIGVLVASSEALTAVEAEKILGRAVTSNDFDPWTWFLIDRGRSLSAVELLIAREWVNEFTRDTARWWSSGHDILLTSTLASPAPPVGVFELGPNEEPRAIGRRMANISPFTIPWNVAGNPAISLPLHFGRDGLPIGVQLVAAYGREDLLLRLAAQIEQAVPWSNHRPPVHA